ncbi:MAG: hypothetical protein ACLFTK_06930, partial [Anaerolineales bacterium]
MFRVMFSTPSPQTMHAERALARQIAAMLPGIILTDDIHRAQVMWACFDQPPTRSEQAALANQAPPHTTLFVRGKTSADAYQTYTTLDALAEGFFASLQAAQADLIDGWWALALPPLPPFAGRLADIHHLSEYLLDDPAPVMLSGPPGVGKSALALALAYHLRKHFPAGAFWLPRSGPDGLPLDAIWAILAQAHPAGRAALAAHEPLSAEDVHAWLADGPGAGLVIADDVRHVAPLAELRAALPPAYRLLVTSPAPLPDVGWHNYPLTPLNGPDGLAALGAWLDMPAHLADEVRRPLFQIAAQLNGHARALRLAAAWLTYAAGWQAGLVYLQRLADAPNPLAHLDTVHELDDPGERALVLALNTLTERQYAAWRAASAFVPGAYFQREALGALHNQPSDFAALVASGLLDHHPAWGYTLPPQLAPYAAALRAESDDMAAQDARLLAHYAAHPVDLGQLPALYDLAAARTANDLADFVLQISGALLKAGQTALPARWLTRLRANLDSDDGPRNPTTLRALGDLGLRLRQADTAQDYYEAALLVYYNQKSLSGQANTLKALGDLRAEAGQREAAQEYYDRTLLLYAQIDFQLGRANTLKALGDLSLHNDDRRAARDYFQ